MLAWCQQYARDSVKFFARDSPAVSGGPGGVWNQGVLQCWFLPCCVKAVLG
jgi:hypothetical protein